jgi:hypothetical protein
VVGSLSADLGLLDQRHRARLWAFVALLLDESDLRPFRESVERSIEHAVPVKVDLTTLMILEKPVTLPLEKGPNPSMVNRQVGLHKSPASADIVLNLPLGDIKCVL